MATSRILVHDDAHHVPARAVASAGLFGIALIHLLDLPGKIHETPYLGAAYIALILAAVGVGLALVLRDERRLWQASLLVAAITLVGFVINRTVGMPNAMDDVGNWLEPLGLASLFVEALVVLVSGLVLAT
ncbi:MAG: hypothetical protein QOJ00_810 [Actinomycetota bacterium]|jgi:hypothetical protein